MFTPITSKITDNFIIRFIPPRTTSTLSFKVYPMTKISVKCGLARTNSIHKTNSVVFTNAHIHARTWINIVRKVRQQLQNQTRSYFKNQPILALVLKTTAYRKDSSKKTTCPGTKPCVRLKCWNLLYKHHIQWHVATKSQCFSHPRCKTLHCVHWALNKQFKH